MTVEHLGSSRAEQRAANLRDLEMKLASVDKERRDWMKTAQLSDEWADHLGKVRIWLQEQWQTCSEQAQATQQQLEKTKEQLEKTKEQLEKTKQYGEDLKAELSSTFQQWQHAQITSQMALAELSTLRVQCQLVNETLTQQQLELEQIKQARLYRAHQWLRRKLLALHSLPGRVTLKGLHILSRLCRRSA